MMGVQIPPTPAGLSGHILLQRHLDWKISALSSNWGPFREDYIFNIKDATVVDVIWGLMQKWPQIILKSILS